MPASYPRCQGRRRMWRGRTLSTYGCGRKATTLVETRVGVTRTIRVCDDPECLRHVTSGYPAHTRPLAG